MRHLIPPGPDAPVETIYAGLVLPADGPGEERPFVGLNMVASVDGAIAVDGRSGPLGGPADEVAFPRLRAACDAILVGAGTVRAEGYRVPRGDDERRRARVRAGLDAVPVLVVVSGSLDLDPDAAVFATREGEPRTIVVTHGESDPATRARLAEVADVRVHGARTVDLGGALRRLHADGIRRVLGEGGPALNGALLVEDLVDELFLTVAPVLVSGDAARAVHGPALDAPRELELVALYEEAGELLTRWRVRR
ncbi:pyrimidine reductase family protein [Nitriliruptoraceae bacterium ZYF776]|nr:pyrimidine reductase family protein [Profundirhabdus halotolerans]